MNSAIEVVVNRGGGTAKRMGAKCAGAVEQAFAAAGARVQPALVEGDSIAPAIERAATAPVVAVGGGDGTQSSAAGLLRDTPAALAVLPLGTLNHLAKDLGVPPRLEDAAKVAVHGKRIAIDLGCVGDTVFVNNASIGLYTRLVRRRDALKLPKWLATIPAAWGIARRMRVKPLTIDLGEGLRTIETPLLFVGNNRYAYEGTSLGTRARLDEGVMSVFAIAPRSLAGYAGFALRALFHRADAERDFLALGEVTELTVSGEGAVDVAHDGEVTRMQLPLTFRILPRALAVMVPADSKATAREGE